MERRGGVCFAPEADLRRRQPRDEVIRVQPGPQLEAGLSRQGPTTMAVDSGGRRKADGPFGPLMAPHPGRLVIVLPEALAKMRLIAEPTADGNIAQRKIACQHEGLRPSKTA